MKLYAGEIRIGKNPVNHTVIRPTRTKPKPAVGDRPAVPTDYLTAPEIMILRHLHDADSVVKLELRGEQKRSVRFEKSRLLERYGEKAFKEVFGPVETVMRLPEEIDLAAADEDKPDDGDGGMEFTPVEAAVKPQTGGVAAAFEPEPEPELEPA